MKGRKRKFVSGNRRGKNRVEGVLLERECTQAEEYSGNVRGEKTWAKLDVVAKIKKSQSFLRNELASILCLSVSRLTLCVVNSKEH